MSAWDDSLTAWFEEMDRLSTYEVDYGDGKGRHEVTLDQFIDAEHRAGFRRTIPGYGPATGGFSGHGISGWVTAGPTIPFPGAASELPGEQEG